MAIIRASSPRDAGETEADVPGCAGGCFTDFFLSRGRSHTIGTSVPAPVRGSLPEIRGTSGSAGTIGRYPGISPVSVMVSGASGERSRSEKVCRISRLPEGSGFNGIPSGILTGAVTGFSSPGAVPAFSGNTSGRACGSPASFWDASPFSCRPGPVGSGISAEGTVSTGGGMETTSSGPDCDKGDMTGVRSSAGERPGMGSPVPGCVSGFSVSVLLGTEIFGWGSGPGTVSVPAPGRFFPWHRSSRGQGY